MSIEAKVTLMTDLERILRDRVTAAELPRVLSALSDQLADYTLERAEGAPAERDDLLDAYLAALRVEGRSPATVERYAYLIRRMMQAVGVPTRSVTVYHLRRYLADEKARGVSDRTLEGTRQVFSAFFGWLRREGLIEVNPVANLGAVKYQKKQKDVYTDMDMERLKFACKSLRDRAIVCFLRSTGCRISEMVGLDRSDVDPGRMECTVLGKGNKERTVYFDGATAMAVQAYLASRTDDSPALFAGRGTDRIHPNGIRKMLKELGQRAKVAHVHPHKFRRTAATGLIRRGMPIQEVAAILGHDKLDTTMQYVVMDQSEIRHAYQKFA